MMALRILPILQVIVILFAPTFSYPIYGTKRYGRSSGHRIASYDPYQSMIRPQSYPVDYYKLYPYAQNYPDDYFYPQAETYPVYYPRTSKYEVYQAVLPYYYQEPLSRPGYYGYGDPVADLEEDLIQKAEREQREEAQPIGHEIMYENANLNEDGDGLEDANAAFLQNLIMSQVYQDSVNGRSDGNYYEQYDYDDGSHFDKPSTKEDEDVRELKQLTQNKHGKKLRNKQKVGDDEIHWFQKSDYKNQKTDKRGDVEPGVMVYADRKPVAKSFETTTAAPREPATPKREVRGQKEEVMMRPATPVRRPFSNSVMELMNKEEVERKRTPSVYDTIKHMLDVEKSLEDKNQEVRPAMKKRLISSDESLTRQLSVLKKVHQ